jgi:transcriptional regulator with XRE-family HTH domain
MRWKSKPRSSSTKLSPRSTGTRTSRWGGESVCVAEKKASLKQSWPVTSAFQQMQKYEKGINRIGAAQLKQIAKTLGVDIPFFYDGDGKEEPDVDSLLVVNSVFSLRLLRAYTAINDNAVQRQLVI